MGQVVHRGAEVVARWVEEQVGGAARVGAGVILQLSTVVGQLAAGSKQAAPVRVGRGTQPGSEGLALADEVLERVCRLLAGH